MPLAKRSKPLLPVLLACVVVSWWTGAALGESGKSQPGKPQSGQEGEVLFSITTPAPAEAAKASAPADAAKKSAPAPSSNGYPSITLPDRVPGGVVARYDPEKLNGFLEPVAKAKASWPSWRRGMKPWHWVQIPGSDLSNVAPKPRVKGSLTARINAWNGLAADMHTNRLFSVANGGHADYAGNEVYAIDLSEDAPRWKMLRGPTPSEDIVAGSNSRDVFHDYYLDGRPSSTHTYYALHFLASRNAVFKFAAGSMWGTGNEANWLIDAFSLVNDDWHPPGTWPPMAPTRKRATAASICMNPVTEQVYAATPGQLSRFDPETGKVAELARWPQNATAVRARACAVDPVRKQLVFFGDGYRAPRGGLRYDLASGALSAIEFKGEDAPKITAKKYHFAWYDPSHARFLLKTEQGDEVYGIDPKSFEVSRIETSGGEELPDARNGVQTRWQRLPRLGGYAYYPRSGSGVWFLATE